MDQPTNMAGQVVLITGASRGLGKGFAKAIARAGGTVALTARSQAGLNETAAAIEAEGGVAVTLACDVADQKAVSAMVAETERQLGPIDVLINNAGAAGPTGNDWEIEPTDWWRVFEVNVLGQFYVAGAVMRGMVSRRRGRVVNVSSGAAGFASPGYSAYCASKAALTLWTECLAGSAERYGISVMAYHPGVVRTDMTEYSAARPDIEVGNPIVETIRELFASGQDDPIEDAVESLLQVAAGVFDGLPGRQIGVGDEAELLLSRTAEIIQEGLYAIRIKELTSDPNVT